MCRPLWASRPGRRPTLATAVSSLSLGTANMRHRSLSPWPPPHNIRPGACVTQMLDSCSSGGWASGSGVRRCRLLVSLPSWCIDGHLLAVCSHGRAGGGERGRDAREGETETERDTQERKTETERDRDTDNVREGQRDRDTREGARALPRWPWCQPYKGAAPIRPRPPDLSFP